MDRHKRALLLWLGRQLPKVGCSIESAEDLAEVRQCLVLSRRNGVLLYTTAGLAADVVDADVSGADDFVAVRFSGGDGEGDGDVASFIASLSKLPDMVVVDLAAFPSAHAAVSDRVFVAVCVSCPSDAHTVASQLPLWRAQTMAPSFGLGYNCRALMGLCRRSGVAVVADKPGDEEREKVGWRGVECYYCYCC